MKKCVGILVIVTLIAFHVAAKEDVLLPDGTAFKFWQDQTTYSKVYHVDRNHTGASDEGPGTAMQPFKTINKAAQVLQPGEKVVVHEGVYREWVHPARGGTGPDQMIWYQAAPGENVVIKGSYIIPNEWQIANEWKWANPQKREAEVKDNSGKVWKITLDRSIFNGYNPLAMLNWPQFFYDKLDKRIQLMGDYGMRLVTMRRALLFQNGKRLQQVPRYIDMAESDGTFWIENIGLALYVRPYGDQKPREGEFEVTIREQVFAPEKQFLGYIRVSGFTIEHSGDGFPPPQRGAFSTARGHHWIIEDNTIRQTNGVGMSVGQEDWHYQDYTDLPVNHIIRRNHISECGMCAIAGLSLKECLVEDNLVEKCGWHHIEKFYENAGMKFHHTHGSLIRRNLVLDNEQASGIWLDFNNANSRVTQNTVIGTETIFAAIWVECSRDESNMIDNNIIINTKGHGIYEHDTDRLIIANNLIVNSSESGVHLRLGQPDRFWQGRGSTARKHRVYNNILVNNGRMIEFANTDNQSDYNVFYQAGEPGPFRIHSLDEYLDLAAWQEFHNLDVQSVEIPVHVDFNREQLRLSLKLDGEYPMGKTFPQISTDFLGHERSSKSPPGPFAKIPGEDDVIDLDPRMIEK